LYISLLQENAFFLDGTLEKSFLQCLHQGNGMAPVFYRRRTEPCQSSEQRQDFFKRNHEKYQLVRDEMGTVWGGTSPKASIAEACNAAVRLARLKSDADVKQKASSIRFIMWRLRMGRVGRVVGGVCCLVLATGKLSLDCVELVIATLIGVGSGGLIGVRVPILLTKVATSTRVFLHAIKSREWVRNELMKLSTPCERENSETDDPAYSSYVRSISRIAFWNRWMDSSSVNAIIDIPKQPEKHRTILYTYAELKIKKVLTSEDSMPEDRRKAVCCILAIPYKLVREKLWALAETINENGSAFGFDDDYKRTIKYVRELEHNQAKYDAFLEDIRQGNFPPINSILPDRLVSAN